MTEYTAAELNTAPAQVLHMRRERSHLTVEQQCARCDIRWTTPHERRPGLTRYRLEGR